MIWVVNSHTHRQVASTILSIVLKPLHRLTPARSLSRGLERARSYIKVCTRRSLEQSHRDAPSCAHLRATWCIKDRQPDHNQALENPYYDMHVINIHASYMSSMNNGYHHNSLQSMQTLIECTKRSQDCDPTLHQTEAN